ncbi:L,D-transpeptidase [Alsobacter metallidurans]|uniref:L,D-transpeptidase n=2 Tax=Alsobacter metallidurans TaxID=340221 RepID=A0A917I354_9HYPH|nr:L,D-transpeptidase [Alsobacter metallidurans]GGH09259.1 L,D-transpeptidase [Alsobacter metallidurans]
MMSRRFVALGLPFVLGGCVSTRPMPMVSNMPRRPGLDPAYYAMYGELPDERFPVPAVNIDEIDPTYLRRPVAFDGAERSGTIVVDPDQKFLYLVQEGGRAMRYGVGVGREGFGWSGNATIKRKAEWPTWTPPSSMILRQPELEEYANGMPGGPENPLGARALYLYQGDRDTLYRIHGTTEPQTIGTRVSSGCIRLINQDVIDLHRRVPTGTRVVVRGSSGAFDEFS